jgi:hypothetical protein
MLVVQIFRLIIVMGAYEVIMSGRGLSIWTERDIKMFF